VLYPYVYLLARAAFLEQSICVLEVSRTLGCGAWCSFYRVALPLARPAIVAGLSLALMETLADYGTVSYFGLGVFTTGIFRTWFGMGDSVAAAKMAALLLLFVFVLVVTERMSRKQARYHHTSNKYTQLPEYRLTGAKGWLAFAMCLLPVVLGFLLPALQLSSWAMLTYEEMVDASFLRLTVHTVLLGLSAALLSVMLALFLAYGKRMLPGRSVLVSIRVAALGYAIPGTVIAVGVMIPFAWLDNSVDDLMRRHFDISTGLLLSGTLFAVLFAYLVRFLAVSLQTVESGLGKIKPSMDDAARSLGYRPRETLLKVHMPLMKGSVLTALLIVFVDVMKELPATLILRPFNFNTLAVRAFELASDERLADSSTAALMIVVVGLLPVIYLSKTIAHSRAGSV
jgi:iron(III) transport system permease protein